MAAPMMVSVNSDALLNDGCIWFKEVTEKSPSSPFSLFAPVESCLSSVGSGEDQAMNAVSQFYLMEIDEQPKGDIQQFHVA